MTIHAPTYPGEVVTLTTTDVEESLIYWPLNLHADKADAGPVVVDDSSAAVG